MKKLFRYLFHSLTDANNALSEAIVILYIFFVFTLTVKVIFNPSHTPNELLFYLAIFFFTLLLNKFISDKFLNKEEEYFLADQNHAYFDYSPVNKHDKLSIGSFHRQPILFDRPPQGYLRFYCPESMVVGTKEKIGASISLSKAFFNDADKAYLEETIEIEKQMCLTLLGSDFEIEPRSSETQVIRESRPTIWTWDVKPKSSGMKFLNVRVTLKINSHGSEGNYDITTIAKTVFIYVDKEYYIKRFFQVNWQWLINLFAGTGIFFSLMKLFGYMK